MVETLGNAAYKPFNKSAAVWLGHIHFGFQAALLTSPVSHRLGGRVCCIDAERYVSGTYSSKFLIGTPEKEKLHVFIRGLDSSVKYSIWNLDPKTYEEALALAQNKELEINKGKKQVASGSSNPR